MAPLTSPNKSDTALLTADSMASVVESSLAVHQQSVLLAGTESLLGKLEALVKAEFDANKAFNCYALGLPGHTKSLYRKKGCPRLGLPFNFEPTILNVVCML